MSCDAMRRRLMRDPSAADPSLRSHLAACDACAAFARDFDAARRLLREHRSDHAPDPLFAQRVSAALPGDAELLGWAAARLLPATLALLLALSAWAWLATPSPSALVESAPSDDPLSWVIEEGS